MSEITISSSIKNYPIIKIGWIGIKDCTPPLNENVILYGKMLSYDAEKTIFITALSLIDNDYCENVYGEEILEISHWMPLPHAPRDEDEVD